MTALGLPSRGIFHANLGDGSRIVINYHEAVVIWHGQPRTIEFLQSETPPLIVKSLLEGSRLTIDITRGGPVTVKILPMSKPFWWILGNLRAIMRGAVAIDQRAT